MEIGPRLRELREGKHLTQGDIENKTGLLRCYLSRVEKGHTIPNVETLEKFARALKILFIASSLTVRQRMCQSYLRLNAGLNGGLMPNTILNFAYSLKLLGDWTTENKNSLWGLHRKWLPATLRRFGTPDVVKYEITTTADRWGTRTKVTRRTGRCLEFTED